MENLKKHEENFNFFAKEISKSYLDKTQNKYEELENKINEFLKKSNDKFNIKCKNLIQEINAISENETLIDEKNNDLIVSFRPKDGKEKDYEMCNSKLIKCKQPFLSLSEQLMVYRENFKMMNNFSYSMCLHECKSNLSKYQNEKLKNYDEMKYCLKDCYNLISFNFKSYYEFISNGVNESLVELEKIELM